MITTKKIKPHWIAVLFDYDGVIADTMADNANAWKKAFVDVGASITEEEYYEREGLSPAAIARELGAKHKISANGIVNLPAVKARYYREQNTFRVYPEIPHIVKRLKTAGKKLALVSGAARHRIEEMTPRSLLDYFDVVIAAEDVTHSKPDPEPYIKALEKLGVLASDAVVVENAPLGILSAKRAGVRCIAISTTLPSNRLGLADIVVGRHADLKALLETKP